jgi:hypothetical protein
MIKQAEIKEVRTQAGILAREVSRVARIEPGRFSYIEQRVVTARPDEMGRIEAALVELITKRLVAIRAIEAKRGLVFA